MSDEKMREDFESQFPVPFGVEWRDGSYHISKPNRQQVTLLSHLFYIGRWETWQASRAALVVDLPKNPNEEFADRAAAIDACRQAIEAAGIKVKP